MTPPNDNFQLLSAATLKTFKLPNRIWMAPMTRSRARADGTPGPHTATYYAQRASAGMIVSEAINISADAIGSPLTPSLFTDAHVAGWSAVTQAVHAAGGRIVAQLWHTGRVGHSAVRDGSLPVAPSALAIQGQQHFTGSGMADYEVPRALSLVEIRQTIDDYARAARRAIQAGFDAVELHAAFGYLPNQFLVDGANQRQDPYGGDIAARCRFVIEVMEALVAACGADRAGIKLSPVIPFNGMVDSDPLALYTHLLRELSRLNLLYVHLMHPLFPLDAFPGWPRDVLATFGRIANCPVVANGGYDAVRAEADIASGRADFVSFGNLFIANPDLPARMAAGAPFAAADRSTMYGGGQHGYTDYPTMQAQVAGPQ